jgi:hypothetical protein
MIQRLARSAYARACQDAPFTAANWLDRFQERLQTLAHSPERCGFAPESRKIKLELRQLLFGRRPNVFRAIFFIDGNKVRVLRILRGQRRFLTRTQIVEALPPDDAD